MQNRLKHNENMTTSLTFEQFNFLDILCRSICDKPKIRFCGVINSMGRLVAGSFKDSIQPLDNDQQRQMLYIQSRLEISMKGEFDESLGCVNHVVTYRDNVVIINIPLKNQHCHFLISAERIADVRKIVDYATHSFEEYILSEKHTSRPYVKETKKDHSIKINP
jgi:hypothetical protein